MAYSVNLLELKKLSKQFHGPGLIRKKRGAVLAVDRVSFSIERNIIFGLVGESGCGKTTLSRAVLYLDPPTSGEVWMDGTLLSSLSAGELRSFRKRMQIVFQDPNSALDPKMRIQLSLEEGLVNLGMSARKRAERIGELLELVGISPARRSGYPHEFSGGQKQRIVIARALSLEPEFLILDEPVSNLDLSIQAQIINLLLDLKEELSLTYLFISHDLNLVAYLSDQIAVMYQGRIVELSKVDELLNHPLHPYTLKLFSSLPGINIKAVQQPAGRENQLSFPRGCPYYVYCASADSACTEREPELKDTGGGHLAACLKV